MMSVLPAAHSLPLCLFFTTPQTVCISVFDGPLLGTFPVSAHVTPIHILNMTPLGAPLFTCTVRLEKQKQIPHCLCSPHTSSLLTVDHHFLTIFLFPGCDSSYSSNCFLFFLTSSLYLAKRNPINSCRMRKLRNVVCFAKQVMSFP